MLRGEGRGDEDELDGLARGSDGVNHEVEGAGEVAVADGLLDVGEAGAEDDDVGQGPEGLEGAGEERHVGQRGRRPELRSTNWRGGWPCEAVLEQGRVVGEGFPGQGGVGHAVAEEEDAFSAGEEALVCPASEDPFEMAVRRPRFRGEHHAAAFVVVREPRPRWRR